MSKNFRGEGHMSFQPTHAARFIKPNNSNAKLLIYF